MWGNNTFFKICELFSLKLRKKMKSQPSAGISHDEFYERYTCKQNSIMESTGWEPRHPLVTLTFPVTPPLFRKVAVVHTLHSSSVWRCQTSHFLGGVISLGSFCSLCYCSSQKEKDAWWSVSDRAAVPSASGGEDELSDLINVFFLST